MDELTLAYLAGIVDGEAYIGIKKTRRKDARSPIYHERIQVRMVDKQSIELLAKTFGGTCYFDRGQAGNRRALYCYQASDAKACRILRALLPYLRVKKKSALNVLRLRKSKEDPRARRRGSPAQRTMHKGVLAFRERLYLRAKAINKGAA